MKTRKSNVRNTRGSAILGGTAGLVLTAAIGIGAVLLLLNSIMVYYYKSKIEFVGKQAVAYAANRIAWNGAVSGTVSEAEPEARDVADRLLAKMGLPATSNFQLRLENGKQLIATFDVFGMAMPGQGNFQAFISLSQTSIFKNVNGLSTPAIINLLTPQGSVRIPANGLYTSGVTNAGLSTPGGVNGNLNHVQLSNIWGGIHNFILGYPASWSF